MAKPDPGFAKRHLSTILDRKECRVKRSTLNDLAPMECQPGGMFRDHEPSKIPFNQDIQSVLHWFAISPLASESRSLSIRLVSLCVAYGSDPLEMRSEVNPIAMAPLLSGETRRAQKTSPMAKAMGLLNVNAFGNLYESLQKSKPEWDLETPVIEWTDESTSNAIEMALQTQNPTLINLCLQELEGRQMPEQKKSNVLGKAIESTVPINLRHLSPRTLASCLPFSPIVDLKKLPTHRYDPVDFALAALELNDQKAAIALRHLHDLGFPFNPKEPGKPLPTHVACAQSKHQALSSLLDGNANAHAKNENGMTLEQVAETVPGMAVVLKSWGLRKLTLDALQDWGLSLFKENHAHRKR